MDFGKALTRLGFVIIGLICLPLESQAYQTPSFSCARATTVVETTICDFRPLAGKDGLLAVMYQMLQGNLHERDSISLIQTQRGWLARRDQCSEGRSSSSKLTEMQVAAIRRCLDALYSQRLKELQTQNIKAAAKRLSDTKPPRRFAPDFWGGNLPIVPLDGDEHIRDDAGDLFSLFDFAIGKDDSFLVSYTYSTKVSGKVRRHFNVYSSKTASLVFHESVWAGGKESVGHGWFDAVWDNAAIVYEYPDRLGSVEIGDGRIIRLGRLGTSRCGHGYQGFIAIEGADRQVEQKITVIGHRPEMFRTAVSLCGEQFSTSGAKGVDGWFPTWGSSQFYHILDLSDGTYLLISEHSGTLIRCVELLQCQWATRANGIYFAPSDTINRITSDALRNAPTADQAVKHMDDAVRNYLQNQ